MGGKLYTFINNIIKYTIFIGGSPEIMFDMGIRMSSRSMPKAKLWGKNFKI